MGTVLIFNGHTNLTPSYWFVFILIIFKNLTEMESIDGIGYSHGKELRTPKQRPEKDFPIINPLSPNYAQMPDRFKECSKIIKTKVIFLFLQRFSIF